MRNGHGSAVLDEMLEPVSRCFGLETARALAALQVDERTQARVEELAGKRNEGQLTPETGLTIDNSSSRADHQQLITLMAPRNSMRRERGIQEPGPIVTVRHRHCHL